MRLVPPHSTHLIHSYPVCIYSGGGGRRFGTLGDGSDDEDDEPQNYFAGGERRLPTHSIVIIMINFLSLSQRDQCSESG